MISLDQICLLEQKIESAVEKIKRLQAENDALRKSCEELTNALSVKSEQLSQFEQEQNQIESGIKSALERLTAIENSVIEAASQTPQPIQPATTTAMEQPVASEQSFEHTSTSTAPQHTIAQNNTASAPQNSVPQNTPSASQNGFSQSNAPIFQNGIPQNNTLSAPQETAHSYAQESVSQESQDIAQQSDAEQQEPFAQSNEIYEEESSVEESASYDQEIENSFDDGLLFSPASDDTEIDDFYDEQESPEDNSSNIEQDSSHIDIY